jgi:hypothetical protein
MQKSYRLHPFVLSSSILMACATAEKLDEPLSGGEKGGMSSSLGGTSTKGPGGSTGTISATGGTKTTVTSAPVTGGSMAGTPLPGTGGTTGVLTIAKGGATSAYTTTSRAPSCTDKVKNGDETDVDCGGACDVKCAFGKICAVETDCANTMPCSLGKCTTCANGVQDGDESDVDCGGSCAKCTEGQKCSVRADCATFNCDSVTGTCGAQSNCLAVIESPCTCAENVLNQGDIEKCKAYVTCYLENDCTPTTTSCTTNDAVCGVNKIGGGNSPIDAATKVYNCACK